jgi:cell fate regulator YaaT (PSP1 superfamily)
MISWVTSPGFAIEELQDLVVKTQHGTEVARVLRITDKMPEAGEDEKFVNEIIRAVDENDRQTLAELRQKERDAFRQTRQKIEEHQLNMKLLKAEYLFDASRVIFYFKSENKVDFRELLKSLASLFKTRIELRQIGVRDETKLLGGIGCCGKEVCCAQFMNTFYPVSTKMAKEQNLSLNPAKLSGICGRLLCCLGHEHEYYASFHGKFPKITSEVVVGEETARVMDINYITRKILLGFPDRRKSYYDLDVVHGRKDSTTGRNLWWIQLADEPEPDLTLLLRNLNPPGSGKKKKKGDNDDSRSDGSNNNRQPNSQAKDRTPNSEKGSDKPENQRENRNNRRKNKNEHENDKKLSDSPPEKDNS